jgi:hypothetical protein
MNFRREGLIFMYLKLVAEKCSAAEDIGIFNKEKNRRKKKDSRIFNKDMYI